MSFESTDVIRAGLHFEEARRDAEAGNLDSAKRHFSDGMQLFKRAMEAPSSGFEILGKIGQQAGEAAGAIARASAIHGLMGAWKSSRPPRIPIATVVVRQAARFVRKMFPKIERLHLVGSRLRHKYARDIEFVAVVGDELDIPSRNLIDAVKTGGFDVDLFFSLPDEVEMHILEFGLGYDIMRWKRIARQKGYRMNRYGLWRGKNIVTRKMADVARLLGLPLKPFLVATLRHPF